MIRKLRSLGDGSYTATGLVLVDWDGTPGPDTHVCIVHKGVPEDVGAGQFFNQLVKAALEAAPVTHHTEARGLLEHRTLPISEEDAEQAIVDD